MKKIVRVGIPALVSIILLVLYFVLEKNEKETRAKNSDECLSLNNQDTPIEKGDQCYIFKNNTCFKGSLDADEATIKEDAKDLNSIIKDSNGKEDLSEDLSISYYLINTHCQPNEIYGKYNLLLWFGIIFAVIAIAMYFIDIIPSR